MSNVIQFLEKIAVNSETQEKINWLLELEELDIDNDIKEAIRNKDKRALELYLGTNINIVCALFPAEDDDDDDDSSEEEPADDNDIRSIG